MAMAKKFSVYLLLFLLLLPALWALLKPGFFPSHDGEWMVVRLSDFHRSLVSGQIPVRWAARLNHQYGYPVFNFLYPLSLYFGEIFHLAGLNFVWSIKAVFIFSFFLSAFFIFLWLKEKWGDMGGFLAALVYVYTPYRMVDVYVRGSLGEALAFVWPPLIFWTVERLAKKFNYRNIAIGSLSLAALICSHNTLALLFIILLGFYLLYLWRQQKSLYFIVYSLYFILLAAGLSAFFWIPAFSDRQFVIFDSVVVSDFFSHFPSFSQLLLPSWGYGPSLPNSSQDLISFQVGILNLIISLIAIFIWLKSKKEPRENVSFFLIAFWLAFFFLLPLSSAIWKILPIYRLIQFPWRLLSLTTFLSAVLTGFLISKLGKQKQILLSIILIIFFLFIAKNYAQPEEHLNRPLGFYTTNEDSTTVQNEYTPIWVKTLPRQRAPERVEIIKGEGEIKHLQLSSKQVAFQATLKKPSKIRLNIHYFPGWQLFINQQKQVIDYESNGLIQFDIPEGDFEVKVIFGETPLRLIADLISLSTFLLVFFCIIKNDQAC